MVGRGNVGIDDLVVDNHPRGGGCLLYTSPSPRDRTRYRMPSSALKKKNTKKKKKNTHTTTTQTTTKPNALKTYLNPDDHASIARTRAEPHRDQN